MNIHKITHENQTYIYPEIAFDIKPCFTDEELKNYTNDVESLTDQLKSLLTLISKKCDGVYRDTTTKNNFLPQVFEYHYDIKVSGLGPEEKVYLKYDNMKICYAKYNENNKMHEFTDFTSSNPLYTIKTKSRPFKISHRESAKYHYKSVVLDIEHIEKLNFHDYDIANVPSENKIVMISMFFNTKVIPYDEIESEYFIKEIELNKIEKEKDNIALDNYRINIII